MAIIPKIKVSSGRKREKCKLLTDSQTTANFGFVQPTFCRDMIPNSKFEVSVNTRVLNAPMPVPTYGRINLHHKHVFIPYVDVCPQFNSFLAAQTYKPGSGTAYVPNSLPPFKSVPISQYVLARYADWTVYARNTDTNFPDVTPDDPQPTYEYSPILMDGSKKDASELAWVKQVYNVLFHQDTFDTSYSTYIYGQIIAPTYQSSYLPLMPSAALNADGFATGRGTNSDRSAGNWLLGGWQFVGDNTLSSSSSTFDFQDYNTNPNGVIIGNPDNSYVTLEDADYICKFGPADDSAALDFVIAFKLRPAAKRFRSILIGLGYQFTPNLFSKVDDANWLKLFAFYKAWFNLYRPKRDMSFTTTHCYNMIKICENSDALTDLYPDAGIRPDPFLLNNELCLFIEDLCGYTSAYLPQDYFGMSVISPNQNYMQGDDNDLDTYTRSNLTFSSDYNNYEQVKVYPENNASPTVQVLGTSYGSPSPAVMSIALKVLKYVNKNTIVGRSIHDYIKVHFGVSLDSSHDIESVYEIGSIDIPVDINIVTSSAGTETDELGSYAARGLGYNQKGNKFEFENRENFGCWMTLTCVMPQSGYYQGILRENMALKRYDWFTPEFDALGYDILLRSEISADYPTQVTEFNQPEMSADDFSLKKAFGFVPRYSHYKVGRNIVSGDMSLRGHRAAYGGYFLDRKIPYECELPYWVTDSSDNVIQYERLSKPQFIPSVVRDNFRRVDPTDRLGNYNRIFYSESVLDDHFIISSTFDVDAWLPAKSLSESFDTITEEDGKVIDIAHS